MSSAAPEPKSEQEVLSTYRQMQQEMQGLIQNLTKVEMERNEHRCVFYQSDNARKIVVRTAYSVGKGVSGGQQAGMLEAWI